MIVTNVCREVVCTNAVEKNEGCHGAASIRKVSVAPRDVLFDQNSKGEDLKIPMKSTKKLYVTALTLAALSAGSWAQTPGQVTLASNVAHDAAAAPAATPPAPSAVTAADVQALKDALAAQQLQIERLKQQLDRQQAQQAAVKAADKTDAAQTQAVPQQLARSEERRVGKECA